MITPPSSPPAADPGPDRRPTPLKRAAFWTLVFVFPFALGLTVANSVVDHIKPSQPFREAFQLAPDHRLRLSVGGGVDGSGAESRAFLLLPNFFTDPGVYEVRLPVPAGGRFENGDGDGGPAVRGSGGETAAVAPPTFRASWAEALVYFFGPLVGSLAISLPAIVVALRKKRPVVDPGYDPSTDLGPVGDGADGTPPHAQS